MHINIFACCQTHQLTVAFRSQLWTRIYVKHQNPWRITRKNIRRIQYFYILSWVIGGTTACSLKSRKTSQSVFVFILQQDFQYTQDQMSRLSTSWIEETSQCWIYHGRVFHQHLAHEVKIKRTWQQVKLLEETSSVTVLHRLISSEGYQVQCLLIFAKTFSSESGSLKSNCRSFCIASLH